MNKIEIKKLELQNFCGYSSVNFDFTNGINVISAPTGYGKTTILNGILTAFGLAIGDIYPTIDGYKIANLHTVVKMEISANGFDYNLKVDSTQKWKTNSITESKQFVGNDIFYEFDGVKMTLKNYKEKIANIWGVAYEYLEMLIDIKCFNNDTTKWKWTDRRKFLYAILNINSRVLSLRNKDEYDLIKNDLQKGTDEINIQKALNVEKRGIMTEQEHNKILIEDKSNELASFAETNFDYLEERKAELTEEIWQLRTQTANGEKREEIVKLQSQIEDVQKQHEAINKDIQLQKTEKATKIYQMQSKIQDLEHELLLLKDCVRRLNSSIEDLQIDIIETQKQSFNEETMVCPTCNRKLPPTKIETLKGEFEKNKADKLANLNVNLVESTTQVQSLNDEITKTDNECIEFKNSLDSVIAYSIDTAPLVENEILQQELAVALTKQKELYFNSTESDKLFELKTEYDNVVQQLYQKVLKDKLQTEIQQLKYKSKELAEQDSWRIRKQNQLKAYIMEKVDAVNEVVNEKLEGISFKFFELNGADAENPLTDDCECIYNGKVYSVCSSGEKIYANMCVHKNLANLLNIDCFVVIDDYNLCTIPFENASQTIQLYTSNQCNINGQRIDSIYTIKDCITNQE